MSVPICRLCESKPAIKNSHIIPAFVSRAIKSDSVTGFLRLAASPDRRIQDSDKHPLLCTDCEQRFGEREKLFNTHIFKVFHESDQDSFDYDDWLHYFMTSLTWRTLILDLADTSTLARVPDSVLPMLQASANTMQRYLLGENNFARQIRNHIVFTGGDVCSPELAAAGPNFMIRRSAGGYTLWTADGFSAVFNNLAGILCVTHIRGNSQDVWRNTKINPAGGRIRQPQNVASWILHDFFEALIVFSKTDLSKKQQAVIEKSLQKNPNAASLRFREADRRLESP